MPENQAKENAMPSPAAGPDASPAASPTIPPAAEPASAREKMLRQSEVDALISERLQRERRRYEGELAEQRRAREQAEQTLNRREDALRAFEMRAKASEQLSRRGLPQSLLGALQLQSEDALANSLASAEEAFRTALEEGVRSRLRGAPPSAPAPLPDPRRMNYQEAATLYQSDRAAYEKRFGGK